MVLEKIEEPPIAVLAAVKPMGLLFFDCSMLLDLTGVLKPAALEYPEALMSWKGEL